mmetsp:Transcript_19234/g.53965  ORF Transcript_19234/g.53965 Transcript_19234/m.53965 type:complete len:232 (+) Transcript_19234:339-1034(+)
MLNLLLFGPFFLSTLHACCSNFLPVLFHSLSALLVFTRGAVRLAFTLSNDPTSSHGNARVLLLLSILRFCLSWIYLLATSRPRGSQHTHTNKPFLVILIPILLFHLPFLISLSPRKLLWCTATSACRRSRLFPACARRHLGGIRSTSTGGLLPPLPLQGLFYGYFPCLDKSSLLCCDAPHFTAILRCVRTPGCCGTTSLVLRYFFTFSFFSLFFFFFVFVFFLLLLLVIEQ